MKLTRRRLAALLSAQAPFEALRPYIDAKRDRFPEEAAANMSRRVPVAGSTLFADITGHVLEDEQLRHGSPYWVSRLDPACGIDLYGNNGIAVADMDGDGQEEIFICQPGGLPNKLFRWTNGKLVDIAPRCGLHHLDDTSSALFLDLRNIGRQDLILLRSGGPELFLNEGALRFRHVPGAFRFARPPQGSFTGMAAADYDRDGRVDVYFCCYSFFQSEAQYRYPTPYHDATNGPPNFLFRNQLQVDGSGGFEDVTQAVGLDANNNRFSFAPAWCDYDGSGWPSLYVANDFGRNNLYRNRDGRFEDIAATAGVEDMGPGMSACWFDENGDGRPDLYVANMATSSGERVVQSSSFPHADTPALREAWRRHTKGNSFYRNMGNGRFADAGAELRLEKGGWAWAADACDFDNDGHPEVYVTAGMLTGDREPDLMSFFWRRVVAASPTNAVPSADYEAGWNGINQFIREGYSWNGHERNTLFRRRGAAYEDVTDGSGLDIAADSRAVALCDFDGDGCVDLLLKSRLGPQLRVLQNRCGQQRKRIGIQLEGVASNRDAIGAMVEVAGQTKWVQAGSGYLSQHTKRLYFGVADDKVSVRITWPSGKVQEPGVLAAGQLWKVREGEAARSLRAFSDVPPRATRVVAGDNRFVQEDTWFVEPIPLPVKTEGSRLFTLSDASGAWSIFRRYLFEYRGVDKGPLALLLNGDGEAIRFYGKVPTAAEAARDLRATTRAALPYSGLSLQSMRRDHFKMGAAMLWSGYAAEALPYLEAVARTQPGNARIWTYIGRVHLKLSRLIEAEQALQRALALDATQAEAWNELGGVEQARGRLREALAHYERALAQQPDQLAALLNAGQCAEQLNEQGKAEAFYRRATLSDASSPEAANGLGLALAKTARYAEAKQQLERAISLRRDYAEAINNLAVLYLQQGQPNDAEAALRYGIRAAPQAELLYLNLSRLLLQRGNRAAAQQIMRELLDAVPQSEVARKAIRELSGP
jgi:tetratricopeptide (TPR) repeat protein